MGRARCPLAMIERHRHLVRLQRHDDNVSSMNSSMLELNGPSLNPV